MAIRRGLVLGLVLGLLACSKGKGIDAELDALKAAGHAIGEFKDSDAQAFHALRCRSGTIDKISAALCEYAAKDALNMGQSAADAWLGQAVTGTVLRRDLLLLALADRDRSDPNGKSIAAVSRSFRRLPKRP